MNAKPSTIKIVPTWVAAARIYMAALINGTYEGRNAAESGILEMGQKLDRLNEQQQREQSSTLPAEPYETLLQSFSADIDELAAFIARNISTVDVLNLVDRLDEIAKGEQS